LLISCFPIQPPELRLHHSYLEKTISLAKSNSARAIWCLTACLIARIDRKTHSQNKPIWGHDKHNLLPVNYHQHQIRKRGHAPP
jgi:hypothetical protein